MTAVVARPSSTELTPAAILIRSLVTGWRELPGLLATNALWAIAGAPLVIALTTGQWWLVSLASLPLAIATTGLMAVAAGVAEGEPARPSRMSRVDPVLALLLVMSATVAERLVVAGGAALVLGCLLGALLAFVTMPTLAYGAARGRRGIAALRGGVIVAAVRPLLAVTLLSISCLAVFAMVATAGVLAVCAPAFVAVFATDTVNALLARIDQHAIR